MKQMIRKYIQILLYFSPEFIRKLAGKIAAKREYAQAMERMKRTKVSKEEIATALDKVDMDCDVMFHISTMNIGKMAGGVKFLSEQIEKHSDLSRHTLLFSALPYRGRFEEYLKTNPTFDVRTAPVAMGAVNEYFALRPDSFRSLHPTHSVVAVGAQAEEYTRDHHTDPTPFGPHSPYYKLLMNRGKIILFGATIHNLTFFHVFEDLLGPAFPVRNIYTKPYRVRVIDRQGKELYVSTPCHRTLQGIRRDGDRKVIREKLSGDAAIRKVAKIGEEEITVVDTRRFAVSYLELMLQGQSIYGHHKVTQELENKINTLIRQFK